MKDKQKQNKPFVSKEELGNVIFFMALAILIFVDYVSATSIPVPYSGRAFQIAILFLGCKIFLTHYEKREWGILLLGAVLSVASFFATKSYSVCLLIMMIMASKNIKLRSALCLYVLMVSAITIIVGILAITGIQGDVYLARDFRERGIEIRYCMGYTHPNTYHIVLIQIMLGVIWLFHEKMKWFWYVIFFMLNIVVMQFTDSRTNLIVGSCILIAYLLLRISPQISQCKGIYIAGFGVLGASILLSVLAVLFGNTIPVMKQINQLWSGRILMAYQAGQQSKITFFSGPQFNCDMGFVSTLYNFGLVIVVMTTLLIIWKLLDIMRRRDAVMLVGFVACIIFFLGEKFSSVEFVTRNLMCIYMLGWGAYESNKSKKQNP